MTEPMLTFFEVPEGAIVLAEVNGKFGEKQLGLYVHDSRYYVEKRGHGVELFTQSATAKGIFAIWAREFFRTWEFV